MSYFDFVTPLGLIYADTSEIKKAIESKMRDAFGQDLDLSPETPQGVLVSMLTLALDNTARVNAETANQINPDNATGAYLDAISALFMLDRDSATKSTLSDVELLGVPETLIPKGSIAETESGDKFETTRAVILDKEGKASVDMIAVNYGRIQCGAGELVKVASSILGWEQVKNPSPAVEGKLSESDLSLRRKRKQTLAKNNVSANEAVYSQVLSVDGVHSLSYLENYTDEQQTIKGISLKPHSLYLCINGGIDEDIARALKKSKTIGAGYNGAHEVIIKDEFTKQDYSVKFDRPKQIPIMARVTVAPSLVDVRRITPAAVVEMADGRLPVDRGFVVGRSVSPFEVAAAINHVEPTIFVKNVELSTDGKTWKNSTIDIKIDEIATTMASSITVIIDE